jgi:hypothetical protein
MAKHRKQHFVPACYLKAWCDPSTPPNQTPYVWVFNVDGQGARRKAPENIFHEADMYTIHGPDGARDLVLEHGLQQLETAFVRVRNSKINFERPLDNQERLVLCAFTAAARARTPSNREHWRNQWTRPLKMMKELEKTMKTATPEQKQAMALMSGPNAGSKGTMTIEQVEQLVEKPLQTSLATMISAEAPLLYRLDLAILVTDDPLGFITCDAPCNWFDPESYKRPPIYRGVGLASTTVEVTLPISPKYALLLNRQGMTGYTPVPKRVVDELNRRFRFNAEHDFVASKNETNPFWFDGGSEPEDSWEKVQARKAAKRAEESASSPRLDASTATD